MRDRGNISEMSHQSVLLGSFHLPVLYRLCSPDMWLVRACIKSRTEVRRSISEIGQNKGNYNYKSSDRRSPVDETMEETCAWLTGMFRHLGCNHERALRKPPEIIHK